MNTFTFPQSTRSQGGRKLPVWTLLMVALITFLTMLPPAPLQAVAQAQVNPGFLIINVNSSKCLDVVNASSSDGANVQQFACHGRANQRWRFSAVPNTSHFLVINMNSGKCLDVVGGNTGNGVNIQQFTCHGGPNQRWQLRSDGLGRFEMVAAHSLKCADVVNASRADQANVQQFTCHNGMNQRWFRR